MDSEEVILLLFIFSLRLVPSLPLITLHSGLEMQSRLVISYQASLTLCLPLEKLLCLWEGLSVWMKEIETPSRGQVAD